MSELALLILTFLAGMALGLFYFGLLWLTVRQLPRTRWGIALYIGSFFLRAAITMTGFFFLMGGRWERALTALCGFIFIRVLFSFHMRSSSPLQQVQKGEEAASS